MIQRYCYNSLKDRLFAGKTIILYGPRQAGKTTLVKALYDEFLWKKLYITSDYRNQVDWLYSRDSLVYTEKLKDIQLLIIDEAQNIPDIWLILKTIHDNFPSCQIIATGSSSFSLAQNIQEPLTGRKREYWLLPLGVHELFAEYSDFEKKILSMLVYGSYPEVYLLPSNSEKRERLEEIVNSSLFKDILQFEWLKKSDTIVKLAKMLAYQIGKPVSFWELANKLQISIQTVERYCTILEQAFIIFRLWSYSKNLRKELSKGNKFYFWDTGIRNALIAMHQEDEHRGDIGELRENFVISEFMKKKLHTRQFGTFYFRRTYDEQEIDLIYENNGEIHGYEIKRSEKRNFSIPIAFAKTYPDTKIELLHRVNMLSLLKPI